MNISHSLPSTVTGVSFSFLTTEDIRRISVKQITNPVLLDDLNVPNIGGLYDPSLGPSDRTALCATCRLSYFTCPGHFGHIELPAPVFHPLFISNMYNLFRGVCLFCHKFKMSRTVLAKFEAKFRLLEHGLLEAAQALDDLTHQNISKKTKTAKKSNNQAEEEKEAGDGSSQSESEADEETGDQFIRRIKAYVKLQLSRASSSKRDNYKDALVYQVRKDLINEFLKTAIGTRKCANCGSPGYTFRKEGYTKIIEYDLSVKQKNQLLIKRPDILTQAKISAYNAATNRDSSKDSDIEMSDGDSEGEGDVIMPGATQVEEEEEEEDIQIASVLPKAANGKVKTSRGRNERVVAPEECRAHLRRLFSNEHVICALIYGKHGPFAKVTSNDLSLASPDMFFMDLVPVAPTRFRPPVKMNDTLFEHSQNELLTKVLNTSYRLRDLNISLREASTKREGYDAVERRKVMGKLLEQLIQLQVDVNSFMDSSKNPAPMRQGKLPPAGVKQGLEKKEGLFRKHMMGKRVNYAARSVISPDANIETNEIGIPPIFARKLTYPEPVTAMNIHEMRARVKNGPKYPGATMVEDEYGHQIFLDKLDEEARIALANRLLAPEGGDDGKEGRRGLFTRTTTVNKKVYRHLQDGDVLILNRQPTLHKPSMMAHKARVLQGEKTIRMHYANCNSYNADFDGDEMNIHFPQNEVARAEAEMIANTDNQYLVPTSGNPIRGLIQDHVVAGVWMTSQDAFFTREEYFQLLYGALKPEDERDGTRLVTLPPTIWKPAPLWTGKQIISTIMKNITPDNAEGLNLTAKTKSPGKLWSAEPKNDKVVFMDGELMYGLLDKSAFGASDYGLVHSVYELYGPTIAGKFLGILSRLFTKFLQHRAFTCRMDDLTLTPEGDAKRHDLLKKGKNIGTDGAIENFPSLKQMTSAQIPDALESLLKEVLRDDSKMAGLDMTVKTKLSGLTSSISDACLPDGLTRKFPHNHMQAMTQSGAKGSAVNARQISCALGQQELEGRRVPVMVSGKTLPSFKPFETKAIAGGYVASRFLTGIKPQEFYFHCMAGREGLIDTAVKTSRSGYLQRCLIKHLEGITVHYDNTVRGSDSSIYQFNYGGDSLDVTKQKHLLQFDFVAQNERSFLEQLKPREVQNSIINSKDAPKYMRKVLKKELSNRGKYEPALSKFSPSRYLGSTSEAFGEALQRYIDHNPSKCLRDETTTELMKRRKALPKGNNFKTLMQVKYLRSLIDPGEAVGLLASQGVGEPSTQMTLNTFHFAGHGAANVTLGIPRLREIVMTASRKPKTPSMALTVRPGVSPEDVAVFCKQASRLSLSQVVDNVAVIEQLISRGDARSVRYTVELDFFPPEEYNAEYNVEPEEIVTVFSTKFPLMLKKEILSEMKKLDSDLKSQMQELGKGQKAKNSENAEDEDEDEAPPKKRREEEEESEVGDGDADDDKRVRQHKQHATYDDDSDDANEEMGAFNDDEIEAAHALSEENSDDEESGAESTRARNLKDLVAQVSNLFQRNLYLCTNFSFHSRKAVFTLELQSDMPKLLLVGIIERTCLATVIREIPGIQDCFQVKNDDKKSNGEIKLMTNGSNFKGLWKFANGTDEGIIEDDTIYSNDIYSILTTYGVEMARAAILREMSGVFGVYNIQVDRRHLELIADYMTFDGGYKPFNRSGICTNPSPLLKASFETTASFISDATLYGDFDDLSTPSGNIVMGRPTHTGTGAFDIVMPVNAGVA